MGSLANMMFWHVTVFDRFQKTRTIFLRRCLTLREANELWKEMKEKYPSPKRYIVLKENF